VYVVYRNPLQSCSFKNSQYGYTISHSMADRCFQNCSRRTACLSFSYYLGIHYHRQLLPGLSLFSTCSAERRSHGLVPFLHFHVRSSEYHMALLNDHDCSYGIRQCVGAYRLQGKSGISRSYGTIKALLDLTICINRFSDS